VGENLNEHIVGRQRPLAQLRHEMLAEAVDIISRRPCPVRKEKQPDGHAEVSVPQGSVDATDREPKRL